MAARKMKSGYTDVSSGKIDPDCWVSAKDHTAMVQGWVHDDRWVEKQLWDSVLNGFAVTIIDRHTKTAVTVFAPTRDSARRQAWAAAGMP